jgi:hypothetical protein
VIVVGDWAVGKTAIVQQILGSGTAFPKVRYSLFLRITKGNLRLKNWVTVSGTLEEMRNSVQQIFILKEFEIIVKMAFLFSNPAENHLAKMIFIGRCKIFIFLNTKHCAQEK